MSNIRGIDECLSLLESLWQKSGLNTFCHTVDCYLFIRPLSGHPSMTSAGPIKFPDAIENYIYDDMICVVTRLGTFFFVLILIRLSSNYLLSSIGKRDEIGGLSLNYTDVMSNTHSGFLLTTSRRHFGQREKPQNQGASSLLRHNDKFNKVMTQRNGKKIRLKGVGYQPTFQSDKSDRWRSQN